MSDDPDESSTPPDEPPEEVTVFEVDKDVRLDDENQDVTQAVEDFTQAVENTDTYVLDAEPLVAHAGEEPGHEAVSDYLQIAMEGGDVVVTDVNMAELHYVLLRKYDPDVAIEYTDWLETIGVEIVWDRSWWPTAAGWKDVHAVALGDAFALAAAEHLAATLVVGADDDYDDVTLMNGALERFRSEGV